jgi:hypothetical protein
MQVWLGHIRARVATKFPIGRPLANLVVTLTALVHGRKQSYTDNLLQWNYQTG